MYTTPLEILGEIEVSSSENDHSEAVTKIAEWTIGSVKYTLWSDGTVSAIGKSHSYVQD